MYLILILTFLINFNAQAEIAIRPLVEPYIGMAYGSIDFQEPDFKNKTLSTLFGIRGLIGFGQFFLGGDHAAVISKIDYLLASEPDEQYDLTDTGWYIGWHSNFGLRLWYVAYYSHKGINQDAYEVKGSGGYKIGVGYVVTEYISLNLEAVTRSYKEKIQGGPAEPANFTFKDIQATISFPFP
jgi:hypothetical protein